MLKKHNLTQVSDGLIFHGVEFDHTMNWAGMNQKILKAHETDFFSGRSLVTVASDVTAPISKQSRAATKSLLDVARCRSNDYFKNKC